MKVKIMTAFVIIALCFGFIGNVNAITLEQSQDIENNDKITMPTVISATGTKIPVKSSITNYTMYYQYIEVSDADMGKIESLTAEITDLFFEMAEEGIEFNIGDETASLTDNQKTIGDKLNEKYLEYLALIPSYNDSNWIEAENNNVVKYPNTNKFQLLWIKLVEQDSNTSYNMQIYKKSGTASKTYDKAEVEDYTKSINDNQTNTSNESENETIQTTSNPNTGISDYIVFLVPVALILGGYLVLTKKNKIA